MHWIDERNDQAADLEDREHRIRSEAVKIYDALWSYIEADIKYANETPPFKQFALFVNGNKPLQDIIVKRSARTSPKEFHFTLSADRHTIATSGAVKVKFHLDICQSGAVCLKDGNGKEAQLSEAARLILDPFLYPQLVDEKHSRPPVDKFDPEIAEAMARAAHRED